jgi:hypothetical protein
MTVRPSVPAELLTGELFISWNGELTQVEPQAVVDALQAAMAIKDKDEVGRLRQRAKRKKQALQFACLDHAWRYGPLPLLHRTDPAKPWCYDIVGDLFFGAS